MFTAIGKFIQEHINSRTLTVTIFKDNVILSQVNHHGHNAVM